MKQNKLFMLLAALLVAMMLIPSIAMAEAATAPKLSITSEAKEYSADLKGNERYPEEPVPSGIVVAAEGVPEDAQSATLTWRTTKPSAVNVDRYGFEMDKETKTFAAPGLYPYDVCENVAIKGDLVVIENDGDKHTYQDAISFNVTLKQVDEGDIAFKKTSYSFLEGVESYDFKDEIELDTKNGTSTYDLYDLRWKVKNTENAAVEYPDDGWLDEDDEGEWIWVDNHGVVTFRKPGTFTLSATTKGTKKTATTTIVVKAKEKDPDEELPPETGYTYLGFKADTITEVIDDEYYGFNAYDYLKVESDWSNFNDSLIWSSSDTTVATVNNGFVHLVKVSDKPITITVKSKMNPAITASVSVIFKDAEEEEEDVIPYTTFAFVEDQPTIQLYDDISVSDYLKASPTNANEGIVFTSNDPMVANVYYYYDEDVDWGEYRIRANKVGTATITAKTVYSKQSTTLTVKVVDDPAWQVKPIKKIAFDVSELTLYANSEFDNLGVWDYLDVEWGDGDDIIWVSTDSSIAMMEDWGEGDWHFKGYKAGEATLTAKSKFGDAKDSIKIIVKEAEELPTQYTTFKFALAELSVYEFEGLNLYEFLATDNEGNEQILWTSSDIGVLQIDQWGGVRRMKPGVATITAKTALSKQEASIKVTVKADPSEKITALSFSTDALTLYEGDDAWLDDFLTVEPRRNTDYVIWTSSDETVAAVSNDRGEDIFDKEISELTAEEIKEYSDYDYYRWDWYEDEDEEGNITYRVHVWHEGSEGRVEARNAGTAVITARSNLNPSASKTITITVKEEPKTPYTSISFTEKEFTVKQSAFTFYPDLYLVAAPADVEGDWLTWTSSNPQIAEIEDDEDGVRIWLWDVGTVTITARSNLDPKVAGSFTLTIKDDSEPYKKISVTQDAFTLTTSDYELDMWDYIVREPLDADDWVFMTSSDPTVVRVIDDTTLSLEDCKPGTATITVRTRMGVAEPVTFTVTHEKEALKSIKFVNAPTEFKKSQGWLDLSEYIQTDPWYYVPYYSDELVWSSSEPQYVVAYAGGGIEFVNPGNTATITVTSADGKVKASHDIKTTDVWVTGITFKKSEITLKVGETFDQWNNNLVIEPADADYYPNWNDWTSSDPSVAAIEWVPVGDIVDYDDEGYPIYDDYDLRVVAKSVGTATISLCIENAYNEVRGSFDVIVTEGGITNIKFAKKEYTKKIGNEDDELKVYFKVEPYNAYIGEKDITIESSDRSTADVIDCFWSENKGMMCAIVKFYQPGTAKITVRSYDNEEIFGSTKVTAEAIAVKKVKLPKKSMKLFYYYTDENHVAYNTYAIQAKVQPSNAWYDISWETSNAGVAFVDHKSDPTYGNYASIITTGPGTATITVTVDDGTSVRQAKMKITVLTKTVDLKLNKKKATIKMIKGKDNTLQLEAFDDETEYEIPVKWTTSNKKVATVDKNGLVTAKKAGTAVITATTKDGNKTTATCNLTVVKKEVDDFKVKSEVSLKVKETKQLKVKVKPADAYNPALAFTSTDEKVVTVDSKGLLTAVGAGEAEIIIKTKDGTKITKTVKVTVTK